MRSRKGRCLTPWMKTTTSDIISLPMSSICTPLILKSIKNDWNLRTVIYIYILYLSCRSSVVHRVRPEILTPRGARGTPKGSKNSWWKMELHRLCLNSIRALIRLKFLIFEYNHATSIKTNIWHKPKHKVASSILKQRRVPPTSDL